MLRCINSVTYKNLSNDVSKMKCTKGEIWHKFGVCVSVFFFQYRMTPAFKLVLTTKWRKKFKVILMLKFILLIIIMIYINVFLASCIFLFFYL